MNQPVAPLGARSSKVKAQLQEGNDLGDRDEVDLDRAVGLVLDPKIAGEVYATAT